MRFDVYANDNLLTRKRFPFLLVFQSALLERLDTTVVVPLGKSSILSGKLAQTLTPRIDIGGSEYVMYTPELAAVPVVRLKKHVTNIETQRDAIVRAVDFLFNGI